MFGQKRKRALVFVDYEYWYCALNNRYHIKPNPAQWRSELEKKYRIVDMLVFGDFDSQPFAGEIPKIRLATNTVITTSDHTVTDKKNMTDFVMLDHLYLSSARRDIGTIIIFTGDGHFQSVIKYLMQQKKKRVVVYGIEGSFSGKLKNVASEIVCLPEKKQVYKEYCRLVALNMQHVESNPDIIPTFMSVCKAIENHYGVPQQIMKSELGKMIEDKYLYQQIRQIENSSVKVIAVNWDKLEEDGIWIHNKGKRKAYSN